MKRLLLCLAGLGICCAAAWLPDRGEGDNSDASWTEVAEGLFVSRGSPHGYAIVRGDSALLLGASRGMDLKALKERHGVKQIELCLLTHHHRDTSALAAELCLAGVKVRAPKTSADWLTPEGVARYWSVSLQKLAPDKKPGLKDRTFGDWSYLVHARGPSGVTCDLVDSETIRWKDLSIRMISTPGHSRDHAVFMVRPENRPTTGEWCFCGDAFTAPGKLWTPYTTDWHHATDEGLVAAAKSLRIMAGLEPSLLLPEHGPPLTQGVVDALNSTARVVDEAAFLKSYERFTKERLKNPPEYPFLAKEQVATAGEKPWSRLSEHLFLTGNTYVLASRDGPILIIDPYNPIIGRQIQTLQKDQQLGPIETVLISHAHNDHYQGLYDLPPLPADKRYQVWTLNNVAAAIGQPYRYCAPYLDIRSIPVDRELEHGETVKWHEYTFHIRHAPGQTWFTMGFDVEIDGRRCFHTADNFFHAKQFSGSGGWSGRNRGWPEGYAASARDVLNVDPKWILAEHGGPYVFSAEDYRRRIAWAEAAAKAADALSISGRHRCDWNPTFIRAEPMVVDATPGGEANFTLICDGELPKCADCVVELADASILSSPIRTTLKIRPGSQAEQTIRLSVNAKVAPGRHVVPIQVREGDVETSADVFVVLNVP